MLDPISWFAAFVFTGIVVILDQALSQKSVENEIPIKPKPIDMSLARKIKIKELENRLILDTELSTEQHSQIVETIKFLKENQI